MKILPSSLKHKISKEVIENFILEGDFIEIDITPGLLEWSFRNMNQK